jgi:hypothetical protein
VISVEEENKRYHLSHISIFGKVEAFHADEMRKIWISDLSRNWEVYSKKVMEVSF